jgi:hypothetical protein
MEAAGDVGYRSWRLQVMEAAGHGGYRSWRLQVMEAAGDGYLILSYLILSF